MSHYFEDEALRLITACPECKRSIVGGWFEFVDESNPRVYVYGCRCGYRCPEPKGPFLFYSNKENPVSIVVKRNGANQLVIMGAKKPR